MIQVMKRAVALLMLLALGALACAGGMYASLGGITKPTLPFHRGLVVQKDGQETLIIESVLNGEPGDYAWIVPLPNPPTKIYDVATGWFDHNSRRFGPRLDRFQPSTLYLSIGVVFFTAALWASWQPSRKNAGRLALAGFLFLVLLAVFFPVYAQVSSRGTPVLRLEQMTVGNYSVEIVKSEDAKALSTWMRKNGGQLPAEAEPVVAQYVKEGWCFLVAKLLKASGHGVAQPLAITFPSKQAIYPLRLTAAQGNRTTLDLVVSSDGTATAKPLQIWNSSRFPESRVVKFSKDTLIYEPLECLAWKGCNITRLRGDLGPEQMQNDIVIENSPFQEQRITIGDRDAFDTWARNLSVLMIGLSSFVVSLICGFIPASRKTTLLALLIVGVIAACLTSVNTHAGIKPFGEKMVQVV